MRTELIVPTTCDLEDAVAAIVAAGSGVDYNNIVSSNEGAPIPTELFASVLLIHQDIEGVPGTLMSLASDRFSLNAPTEATVRARYSVQWFRRGARDAARRLAMWTSSPDGLSQATRTGLTVLRVSDVRQLDDIVSDAWEERAGVDIEIGYVQTIDQTIGYVRTVPVEVQAGGQTQLVEVGNDS